MTKSKRLLAFVMCIFVVVPALLFCNSFVVKNENDFQSSLTSIYKKYDMDFDRNLLKTDDFALARLITVNYNNKDYGEVEKAVDKNGFAVLQFDSPAKAKNACNQMREDGLTVDADGFATLNAYGIGEMHTAGSDILGTKTFASNFKINKDDVLVAVIDTGVMLEHPDLKDRFYNNGYDFSTDGYSTAEYDKKLETSVYFHSTLVSGIIANNTMDNVKIVPYKTVAFGENDCQASAVLASLNSAIELNVDVVNMSVGIYSSKDVFHSLVKKATNQGICVCASSGNSGKAVSGYPATFAETITVGALNKTGDKIASYSCYGSSVDFVAIGSGVTSTMPTENGAGYGTYSGTSFSAPYITALCADIKSMNKNLSRDDVYKILCDFSTDMGDEGKDDYYGNGVPNISNIVYSDNESYEYRLPQGELDVYSAKDYTEKTQPWALFREQILNVNVQSNKVGNCNFFGMANAKFNKLDLISVGSYAFNGCKKLDNQTFSVNVLKIGEGAYKNIRNDFTISGYSNTPAEDYTSSEGIRFISLGCRHNFSREIIEPEGNQEGYTLYTCLACGNKYRGAYIPPEIISSGKCGDNVEYDFYNTGRLVVRGSGNMYDYEFEKSPFYSFRHEITSVNIEENVTSISPFAFADCKYIKTFKATSQSFKIVDNSVYLADGKTLIYAYSNNYEMPNEVECFNASAFINSNVNVNDNFTVENNLVYDKNGKIIMALPSYNDNVLTINKDVEICDYAFIWTKFPTSVRDYSQNTTIGKYAIGYSFENGMARNEIEFSCYDTSKSYIYAIENIIVANALNSGKCGDDVYWHFNIDSGELRISGNGSMYKYTPKETIPWYDYTSKLQSVVVEECVTSLSIYSFFDENNVKEITVPASLEVVNSQTVWLGCKHVEQINITGDGAIPNYGTVVRSSTYTYSPWHPGRNSLKSVNISQDIESIGSFAFRGCTALKEITLNNCVQISDYAFYEATNLEKLTNFNKSTFIGGKAFSKAGSQLRLCGYMDSTTKDFAVENGIAFDSIGCEHSRGYTAIGERAVCCYDSNVEYTCIDCKAILYNEYKTATGNGHFVKATVLTIAEKPIENADVYVDGVLLAKTNSYGRFVIDEIKCEEIHNIEIKKQNALIASTTVETNGSNRQGDLIIRYGDFINDNVINAKDYAYALKNNLADKDKLDYGRITEDDNLDINQTYSKQRPPTIYSVYNEPSNEANREYRRNFLAEFNLGKDYIPTEAGFVYGKDMDDDFMCLENVGKKNAGGYELKKISGTDFTESTYKFSYGSTSKTGKVGARFYIKYTNGVKEYIEYSDVTTYFYE